MSLQAAFDAVVLAGGAGARLGADKPELRLGGARLIDRVLAAVSGAARVVVVGPPRQLAGTVVQLREEPPGGGPLAALAAALAHLSAPWTVLLAADLPFLTFDVVASLLEVAAKADGAAVLGDAQGRPQWLAGAYPTDALRRVMPADPAGRALGSTVGQLVVQTLRLPTDPGRPPPWLDCDTPAEFEAARRWQMSTLEDWTTAVVAALGLPAESVDRDLVLDLARDVAHGVARPAAPLTTYLVGLAAGRAGGEAQTARALADRVAALAREWPG